MINISEATAIALHAMIYISNRPQKVISLKEIAATFNISEHHLSKVLQRLVKAGYLISIKGPKGGFQIEGDKKNSSFLEIYEIIEGKFCPKNCLFSSKKQDCKNCIMGGLIDNINKEFFNYMANKRLCDFKL